MQGLPVAFDWRETSMFHLVHHIRASLLSTGNSTGNLQLFELLIWTCKLRHTHAEKHRKLSQISLSAYVLLKGGMNFDWLRSCWCLNLHCLLATSLLWPDMCCHFAPISIIVSQYFLLLHPVQPWCHCFGSHLTWQQASTLDWCYHFMGMDTTIREKQPYPYCIFSRAEDQSTAQSHIWQIRGT